MDKFTPTFTAALFKRERRPLARITYYDLLWRPQEIVTGLVMPDSSFSLDEQGRRQVPITLKNSDGSRTPDPTSSAWFGRFGVEWGLRTTAGEEYIDLGQFVAMGTGARATPSAGWASLQLQDKSGMWGTFSDWWVIRSTDRIVDVIKAIALDAGEIADNLVFIQTEEVVGADMTGHPGDSRWEMARRIAQAAQDVGLTLNLNYRGAQCYLYPEVDPATDIGSSFTFALGDGIMTGIDKRWEQQDFANRIQVYGGSGKAATLFSELVDTSSGPYGTVRRGDWCFKWPQGQEFDPLINTQERADARCGLLFRERRSSQELITITGLVVPGFALSDVVTIREQLVTRTNANYTLRGGYSFGLGPAGSMTLGVRRVVMPG